MASNTTPVSFEFQFDVACVKTYTASHTFTREDVENWIDNRNVCEYPEIQWDELTTEEKEAFFATVKECYSYADQSADESRNTTFEYDGCDGEDEDYDVECDGLPSSVEDELEHCWKEWLDARGYSQKIVERYNSAVMNFENDDGLKLSMTYGEWMKHKDYEGEDKVWLQLVESVNLLERHTQIWIKKPEDPSKEVPSEVAILTEKLKKMTDDFFVAEGKCVQYEIEIAELKALLVKKDKMIKALTEME